MRGDAAHGVARADGHAGRVGLRGLLRRYGRAAVEALVDDRHHRVIRAAKSLTPVVAVAVHAANDLRGHVVVVGRDSDLRPDRVMPHLGIRLATITCGDLLPRVTLTEEQVQIQRADTVQIAGGRVLHHALALAAGVPRSGLPAGRVHRRILGLPQHAMGAHVGRNLIHGGILHVHDRPDLGTRIHLVDPLAHPVAVAPSCVPVGLPVQREHALAHIAIELVEIMVDLRRDVAAVRVMVAAASLAGLTRPIGLAAPRRVHIAATLRDLHDGRVRINHARHVSGLPAGNVDDVHVRAGDRRDSDAQHRSQRGQRPADMPTQTLVLRLAFVVEDTQIPLLPAPKSGANRKAIPKWDGLEN